MKYLSPKQRSSYLEGFAGILDLGDRNVKRGTDSKNKGGLGQGRMEPSFGSVKDKNQREMMVPDREVSQLWLNLQSLSHSHGKRRRGNC